MDYLDQFLRALRSQWKGSLVRVSEAEESETNAKKYLNQLAKRGDVERVTWGWYWIPATYKDFFDFLAKDRHFKVLHKQTAAAFWNGDFVHRDQFRVAVSDKSYRRALEAFTQSRGWNTEVETRQFEPSDYRKSGRLYVEALEDTIVDCVKEWAFTDAFASLYQNYRSIDWDRISKRYWERAARSDARVGQILKYATNVMNRESGKSIYPTTHARVTDEFVRRQVEEAAEKVVEFA